jgi:hypothetical protein
MSELRFTFDILKATMGEAKQANAQSIHIVGFGFDLKMEFFREAEDTLRSTIAKPSMSVNSLVDIYRNPPREPEPEGSEHMTPEQRAEMEQMEREYLSMVDPLAFENLVIDEQINGGKV